jgi:hypothetical protein
MRKHRMRKDRERKRNEMGIESGERRSEKGLLIQRQK